MIDYIYNCIRPTRGTAKIAPLLETSARTFAREFRSNLSSRVQLEPLLETSARTFAWGSSLRAGRGRYPACLACFEPRFDIQRKYITVQCLAYSSKENLSKLFRFWRSFRPYMHCCFLLRLMLSSPWFYIVFFIFYFAENGLKFNPHL